MVPIEPGETSIAGDVARSAMSTWRRGRTKRGDCSGPPRNSARPRPHTGSASDDSFSVRPGTCCRARSE